MPCSICSWSPHDPDYLFVHETGFWRVVLSPNQSLLGRCVIHLRRHCGDLAEISPAEVLDWLDLVGRMETALRRAFDATMFNWSCYMNLAYLETPADPHVHWWAVPRYTHPVQVGRWVFEDPSFGHPYNHSVWRAVPEEIRQHIADRLKQAMLP